MWLDGVLLNFSKLQCESPLAYLWAPSQQKEEGGEEEEKTTFSLPGAENAWGVCLA